MSFRFHKCHSLGNDFVIILADGDCLWSSDKFCAIADRHRGVGFDQLMWAWPASAEESVDYFVRIFNSDGSESGQCVNGLRATGYLLQSVVNPEKRQWCLQVAGQPYQVMQTAEHEYGLLIDQSGIKSVATAVLDFADEKNVTIGVVDVGNPHAVWRVRACQNEGNTLAALALAQDAYFTQGVNVGVCQLDGEAGLILRVLERGAGWTDACGSGALAAALSAKQQGWLTADEIRVRQPGGDVKVSWLNEGLAVRLTGPVAWVFSGEWRDEQ